MSYFEHNGIKYYGKDFQIKQGVLYVDGNSVADLNQDTEYISVSGEGNLYCDKVIIINGSFSGNITSEKVIINGEHTGEINATKVINNK